VGVWASLLTIAILSLSVSMLLYFWVIEKIDVTQASLSIYLLRCSESCSRPWLSGKGLRRHWCSAASWYLPQHF